MNTTSLDASAHSSHAEGFVENFIALPLSDTDEPVEPPRRPKRRRSPSPEIRSGPPRDHPWLNRKRRSHRYEEDVSRRLHNEILDFVAYISPAPEEHAMRHYAIRRIESIIHSMWPSSVVHTFGSYNTRLYLPISDIDLVVIHPTLSQQRSRSSPLYRLAEALKAEDAACEVRVIDKARVPIIKFTETITRYHVDISFNVSSGIDSAIIVKDLVQNVNGLRELVLVLKWFLNQRGLNEVYTGGLGSYTITCLIANFLQIHPKIQSGEIRALDNLGILLIEFFELYGKCFNYEEVGVRIGTKNNDYEASLYNKDRVFRYDEYRSFLLSVEDPQDPKNDISKQSYNIKTVRQTFSGAYELLTASLCRAYISLVHANGRPVPVADNPASFLGAIVEVSDNVIQHRTHVIATFATGQLQRLVGIDDMDEVIETEIREAKERERRRERRRKGENNEDEEYDGEVVDMEEERRYREEKRRREWDDERRYAKMRSRSRSRDHRSKRRSRSRGDSESDRMRNARRYNDNRWDAGAGGSASASAPVSASASRRGSLLEEGELEDKIGLEWRTGGFGSGWAHQMVSPVRDEVPRVLTTMVAPEFTNPYGVAGARQQHVNPYEASNLPAEMKVTGGTEGDMLGYATPPMSVRAEGKIKGVEVFKVDSGSDMELEEVEAELGI